jgi:RHS repeat-associated protein
MQMVGRSFDAVGATAYRYGFNGKENDNEVKGEANQQDYGMRIYDPRIGKFLSVDPLTRQYPFYTPYSFAGNKPIYALDLDGAEELPYWKKAESSNTVEHVANFLYNAVGSVYNGIAGTWNSGVKYTKTASSDGFSGLVNQVNDDYKEIKDGIVSDIKNTKASDFLNTENYWNAAEDFAGILLTRKVIQVSTSAKPKLQSGNHNSIEVEKPKSADHHIATNKNNISTARGGPWTPRFKTFFDKAGLDINKGAENLVNVLNHKGPHPEAYHQLVFDRLTSATQGLKANTAAYKTAVTNTLQTIGKEAQTVGSTVNKLLTKNP